MNNVVDVRFYELVSTIKNKILDEVYEDIVDKYMLLLDSSRDTLEAYFIRFPFWGKLNYKEDDFDELYNRAKSLKEHIDDYVWLYEKLEDYRSKMVLYAVLSNWYFFEFDFLEKCIERSYSHYFDLDIVKGSSDEVIVDLGAYCGETVLDYFDNYGKDKYKKIYCYEASKSSCEMMSNNLDGYDNIVIANKAASDKNEKLYFIANESDRSANTVSTDGELLIDGVSIDSDIKEKISLIKMDIEGAEEKALRGCFKHIKNDHPKLLISVYHNHEDLYKIPLMINDMSNDYKYYLRYYGGSFFPTEIVLIAV